MNIRLSNVTKVYENRKVLDVEDLLIPSGSRFGIIGQNGSGKSTLMNIVAGILTQTAGKVYYGDEGASGPDFKAMTLVQQQPYLLRTSVEKNIAYPLKLRQWEDARISARVDALLAELGLASLRRQKAWKLSAGEGQKVALARALSFFPDVLLLDEPTANIDPGTTGEIEEILKRTNAENGTTVVIITHNLPQAKRLCNEIAFLHQGKRIEQGGATLLSAPQNELTAQFIAGELL